MPVVRQDKVIWLDQSKQEDTDLVRYTTKSGEVVIAQRKKVSIYAPVSASTLMDKLLEAIEQVGSNVLASAIRAWQRTGDPADAVIVLSRALADADRLLLIGWKDWQLNHNYVWNPYGPRANLYVTQPGDDYGCTQKHMAQFAKEVTSVGRSVGGSDQPEKAPMLVLAKLATVPEVIEDLRGELLFLRGIARKASRYDWDLIDNTTASLLPEEYHGRCYYCEKLIPLERRRKNIRYCSNAHKQAAYRQRKMARDRVSKAMNRNDQ
jgi:hypothetical protein